ncbi:MAG: NEL-type E3 ubiquitin ligase domain-containing protein, partial [Flammeovirgaceae bacterium]
LQSKFPNLGENNPVENPHSACAEWLRKLTQSSDFKNHRGEFVDRIITVLNYAIEKSDYRDNYFNIQLASVTCADDAAVMLADLEFDKKEILLLNYLNFLEPPLMPTKLKQ